MRCDRQFGYHSGMLDPPAEAPVSDNREDDQDAPDASCLPSPRPASATTRRSGG
jgi:hypothetical protein